MLVVELHRLLWSSLWAYWRRIWVPVEQKEEAHSLLDWLGYRLEIMMVVELHLLLRLAVPFLHWKGGS